MKIVTIQYEILINGQMSDIWNCFISEIEQWWPKSFCANPTRTQAFKGEFKLGGKLYEDWGNGDGWVWYTIYKLDMENFGLRANGMMSDGLASDIRVDLVPKSNSEVIIRLTERVTGEIESKETTREEQTEGWDLLLGHYFKQHFESKR